VISTQARRLWLTHWDSCTYAPVLSPRLDSAVPSRHLVRLWAQVLCRSTLPLRVSADLDSSVSLHPHLQLSDNSPLHIVGLPSFTQPPYGLDVFPEHAAEGFTTTGIPVLNSLGLHYRSLSSVDPPPAHLGQASTGSPRTLLFTALVANVAYPASMIRHKSQQLGR
jgi:hypothetical protein